MAEQENYTGSRTTPQQAQERWGIEQAAYYKRLKGLGIKASRDSQGTYLNSEQIEVLDQLDNHIKEGGTVEEFKSSAITVSSAGSISESSLTAQEGVRESTNVLDNETVKRFDRASQEQAASILLKGRQHVTGYYLENPHELDADLRDTIFKGSHTRHLEEEGLGKLVAGTILSQRQKSQ